MTRLSTAAAVLAALSFHLPPSAHASDILGACAGDIAQYCSAVEVGHGRIASCLYAHETVISEACYTATSDIGDALDIMFSGLRVVLEACGPDIAKHCAGVPAGEGRIFSCLAESRGDLAPSCAPAVDQFTAFAQPNPAQ